MVGASSKGGSTQISRIIKAPRQKVYQAFLDPAALAVWLAPDSMRAKVHTFEPREGGRFCISPMYQNPEDSQRGNLHRNWPRSSSNHRQQARHPFNCEGR